jgi:hypothetical protein
MADPSNRTWLWVLLALAGLGTLFMLAAGAAVIGFLVFYRTRPEDKPYRPQTASVQVLERRDDEAEPARAQRDTQLQSLRQGFELGQERLRAQRDGVLGFAWVHLTITPDGRCLFFDEPLDRDDLRERLAEAVRRERGCTVIVSAPTDTPSERVTDLLNLCAECGAAQVRLAPAPPQEMP